MITINVGQDEVNAAGFDPNNQGDVALNNELTGIEIVVGPEPVRIKLNIRKSVDDEIIIYDHQLMDIVIIPKKNKVTTIPKRNVAIDSYPAQNRFFAMLEKKGVTIRGSIRSGPVYNSLMAYYPASKTLNLSQIIILLSKRFIDEEKEYYRISSQYTDNVDDMFLEPDEEDSTELGEIPQEIDMHNSTMAPYTHSYYYTIREQREN